MSRNIVEDVTFQGLDFSVEGLNPGFYDACLFLNCQAGTAGLKQVVFSEVTWEGGSWVAVPIGESLALRGMLFRNVEIRQCDFSRVNALGLSLRFENCKIEHVHFVGLKITGTQFLNCSFRNCDFSGCDLKESNFNGTSFDQVLIDGCNLEKADFRTAREFSIDPRQNKMKGARFAPDNLTGLLQGWGLKIGH